MFKFSISYCLFCSNRPMTSEYIDQENLLKLSFDGVREHEDTTVECSLQIPDNLPLSNNLCSRIVQVSYELQVRAVSSGFHRDVVLNVPITIGSVPIEFVNEGRSSGNFKTVLPYQLE
jgi:Arrestin (or S-antigen), C-terminal domain